MPFEDGYEFNLALCKILQVPADHVSKIVIEAEAGYIPQARVTYKLDKSQTEQIVKLMKRSGF